MDICPFSCLAPGHTSYIRGILVRLERGRVTSHSKNKVAGTHLPAHAQAQPFRHTTEFEFRANDNRRKSHRKSLEGVVAAVGMAL